MATKLLKTIDKILSSPTKELHDRDYICRIIYELGIERPRFSSLAYCKQEMRYVTQHMKGGVMQSPRQLADMLVEISKYRIEKYLDIGCFTGYTTCIIGAYLLKLNPKLELTAIDTQECWTEISECTEILPLNFYQGTSDLVAGEHFDFVFIDGNASYEWVKRDYENVGKDATLCAIHNVSDLKIETDRAYNGGAPRFWNELKKNANVIEYNWHSENRRFMGIGLRI